MSASFSQIRSGTDQRSESQSYQTYLASYYREKTPMKIQSIQSIEMQIPVDGLEEKMAALKQSHRGIKESRACFESSEAVTEILEDCRDFQRKLEVRAKVLGQLAVGSPRRYQAMKDYLNVHYQVKFFLSRLEVKTNDLPEQTDYQKIRDSAREVHQEFPFSPKPLSVVKIKKEEDKEELAQAIEALRCDAFQKYFSIIQQKNGEFETDEDQQFFNAHWICKLMLGSLEGAEGHKEAKRGLLCKDQEGRIQSIGLYDKRDNRLLYVVTNPDNIRHPINEGITTKVYGAGTQIILYLAKRGLKRNLDVQVTISRNAYEFYRKLYFESVSKNEMILTLESMKYLFP